MAKLIAKTYGDALFQLALEENKLDKIYEEALVLSEALKENSDLPKIMSHPKISKEEKVKLTEDMLKDQVSNELSGFMVLLVSNNRFPETEEIFEYFIHLVKEHKKIGIAYVETAAEISDAQKQQIVNKLLETTKYESFEMHYHVQKSLIGGMVIRINDRVVDSSIKTKLQGLTKDLMQIQFS